MDKPSGNSDPSRRRRRSRRRKKKPTGQAPPEGSKQENKPKHAKRNPEARTKGGSRDKKPERSSGDRNAGRRKGPKPTAKKSADQARPEKRKEKSSPPRPPKRIGNVQLNSPSSLERLRNRIEDTARELHRLREENAALVKRLSELEANPMMDLEGTLIALDENPEAMREKIQGYIAAIDNYLVEDDEENA